MKSKFRKADTSYLDVYQNTELDPLKYAIESILWLIHQHESAQHGWTGSLDPAFIDALEAVLTFFHTTSSVDPMITVQVLRERLAFWRNDIDATNHPLAQLGRVLSGEPGEYLEYRGPVFLITIDDVFEGIAHEYLAGEWDLTAHGNTFLGLCAVGLATIAQTCYWATKAQSPHLDTELGRLFRRNENRKALRGQLANLIVAGQALGWETRIEFAAEAQTSTPDWSIGDDANRLYVECTSSAPQTASFNDSEHIRLALAHAWNEKKGKFVGQFVPGLISCDISRAYVSREHQTVLNTALLESVDLVLPNGQRRTVGVYHTRDDFDLLAQESFNRTVLGVLASALYSRDARDHDIRGFLAYQGQQILINTINGQLLRPQRGILAWRGPMDERFRNAIKLAQPAISNRVGPNQPPCYVHVF